MNDDLKRAAARFIKRGFAVTLTRQKQAYLPGWPDNPINPQKLPAGHHKADGIAIILDRSNLIDLEADSAEADAILAEVAPETGMVWEHAGRRHYGYKYEGEAPKMIKVEYKGETVVELRTGRNCSTVPPSNHPDGEPYTWVSQGEPALLNKEQIDDLSVRARLVAVAAYVLPFWVESKRNALTMALAGYLVRRKVSQEAAEDVVRAICIAADDNELAGRLATVRATYRKVNDDQ